MPQYVALLRGINVGGSNLIKMTALAACFEEQGFQNVSTYIASGNVLFESSETSAPKLIERIESSLCASFSYEASIVLRTKTQMQKVIDDAPRGFGTQPDKYRYDVVFLKPSLTPIAAMKSVVLEEGVDQAWTGSGVLYFSRLASKAAQSKLSKLASTTAYKSMTIRNWNTTSKLLQLLNATKTKTKAKAKAKARAE